MPRMSLDSGAVDFAARSEAAWLYRTDFCREIGFLLDVLATGPSQPLPQPPTGIDWPVFIECVNYHLVAPAVGAVLGMARSIPDEIRHRLRDAQRNAVFRAMGQISEVSRLAQLMAEAGLEVLTLKGPALSMQLYGAPHLRLCRDIDLLVRPKDEAAVRALLMCQGYGTTTDFVSNNLNAVMLKHPDRTYPIELHTRLADDDRLFPLAALRPFESAIEVEIAGLKIRTLSLEVSQSYAAYHGGKHHWSRLYWLADFAAAMTLPEIDWSRVAELSELTGTERHLALAFRLSHDLLGKAPVALRPLRQPALTAVRRAVTSMPAILIAPPPANDLEVLRRVGLLKILIEELGLYSRFSARKALLMARMQITDKDRAQISLPHCLSFFYFAIKIIRVLWQAMTSAMARRA